MSDPIRIGFVADTHGRKADGSDLPDGALEAFAGVDRIIHLGDVGKDIVLERLRSVAPVEVPVRGKGIVVEEGGVKIGVTFDISKLPIGATVGEAGLSFLVAPTSDVLSKGFGGPVDVVAFGGTHRQLEEEHEGVLFFNPGSAGLPADKQGDEDRGSVAILDVADGKATVRLIRLS